MGHRADPDTGLADPDTGLADPDTGSAKARGRRAMVRQGEMGAGSWYPAF